MPIVAILTPVEVLSFFSQRTNNKFFKQTSALYVFAYKIEEGI